MFAILIILGIIFLCLFNREKNEVRTEYKTQNNIREEKEYSDEKKEIDKRQIFKDIMNEPTKDILRTLKPANRFELTEEEIMFVEKAIEFKRSGKYIDAEGIYKILIHDMPSGALYSSWAKTVACDERYEEACFLFDLANKTSLNTYGEADYNSLEHIEKIKNRKFIGYNKFLEYMKKLSGNKNYVFKTNEFKEIEEKIISLICYQSAQEISSKLPELSKEGIFLNFHANDKETPLFKAIHKGIDVVKLLTERGADVNFGNLSKGSNYIYPIQLAVSIEDQDIIDHLLKKGVNINFQDEETIDMFMYCIANSDIDILKKLVSHGLNIFALNSQILKHAALAKDYKEKINYLISLGLDVNTLDNDGNSSLLYVVKAYSRVLNLLPVVMFLLEKRANINVQNREGKTPLILASEITYYDQESAKNLIELLLKSGADISLRDFENKTALMTASFNANIKIKGFEHKMKIPQEALIFLKEWEVTHKLKLN